MRVVMRRKQSGRCERAARCPGKFEIELDTERGDVTKITIRWGRAAASVVRDTETICYGDLLDVAEMVKWRSAALEPLGRVQIAAMS
jgi:hypothetical protein